MADSAVITIRRQVLEVEVSGTELDGLALQRRLPDVCNHVLAPVLESALGKIDPGDAHLYVERLAIELTGVSPERLDAELAEAVRREVEDYFHRNVPVAVEPAGSEAAVAAGDVQRRTVAQTMDEALVMFLRTGRLPWSFRVPSGERLEDLILDAWAVTDATRDPLRTMQARLRAVLAEPSARIRLLAQFSPRFALALLAKVSPQLATTVQECLAQVGEIGHPTPASATLTRRLWDTALGAASAGRDLAPYELAGAAWDTLAAVDREDRALAAVVERRWPGVAAPGVTAPGAPRSRGTGGPSEPGSEARGDRGSGTPRRRSADAPGGRPISDVPRRPASDMPSGGGPDAPGGRFGSDVPSGGSSDEPSGPSAAPVTPDDSYRTAPRPAPDAIPADLDEESDGLAVDNAGIALLHPFLPRIMEGLGVAVGDELVDPGRALCLLHYLATGELTAPEHQLTVAKVLCNVPLDEPVEADVGLTAVETGEAAALLQAAIGHWEALRGTSPAALRGEFLMRPGQLSRDGDGDWLLRVETRTVDILLDQLPWGISMITLPWMSRVMRVEWR